MQLAWLNPLALTPPLKITRITDQAGLDQLQDFFDRTLRDQSGVLGWDIETTPLKDFYFRRCRTIQFGNQVEQYVIDLLAFCDSPDQLFAAQGGYGCHLTPGLKRVMDTITRVVCTRDYLKVGVQLSFEYMMFYWLFGLRAQHFFDCALVEKCIWAGAHSMKDYSFFSMEEMMARYFQVQIDKKYQESFTLDAVLADEQIAYAALDTRFPLALMQIQNLVLRGETTASLKAKGRPIQVFSRIDPLVTGDNLVEIAKIENDAIGAFQDMHVHGERLDRAKWLARVNRNKAELKRLIAEELDPIFVPVVGSKTGAGSDAEVEAAEARWKRERLISDAELDYKARIRVAKRKLDDDVFYLQFKCSILEQARKAEKEKWKKVSSDIKKRRTRIRRLAAQCEGDALINYGSDKQLLKVIRDFAGLKKIPNLEDDTLEKFSDRPVIAAIRKLHGLNKKIGTYGEQWAMEWTTKPCKDQGWLNPGDGRLHCVFNQYDAETGRSSSEKPNGQNLEQDKEVRGCFIADAPDESIRISNCCDADTVEKFNNGMGGFVCTACGSLCETYAEDYVIVTADMSGAELRIIAEVANDPVWIGAFQRKEDVHSVGTELLYEEEWPAAQLPGCGYYKLKLDGVPQRKKCDCPEHKLLREDNKSTNFLLAYGGTEHGLAVRIKKPVDKARELMALHKEKNPRIWGYLEKSGRDAESLHKAFDMFGRRRLFPAPDWDRAKVIARDRSEEKLRLKPEIAERNVAAYIAQYGHKPKKDERWFLTHMLPSNNQISSAFAGMSRSIGRQGKNHRIQGTNATIAKLAMGCGYSPDGKPYLWHTLPQYEARLLKFVHDELVVHCPRRFGEKVAALIGDAFRRAAAEKMTKVVMEFEYNIATYWKK